MNSWRNNIEAVQTLNTWMEIITLAAATLTFISLFILWLRANEMTRHFINRERRSSRRIKAV